MLPPNNRKLLVDLLAPPSNYDLIHAIATTFTLDLSALLMVPLGFAGRDLSLNTNEIELLQKVNTFADRMDVFCQAGSLKIPQKHNQLFSFLEPVIHQVWNSAPGSLFHPKIWVLRFSHQDSHLGEPDLFRFICGSRNLTFDRSWDAFVSLDGTVKNRRNVVNSSLCRFLESLPGRTGGLSLPRQKNMSETIAALQKVNWERPDGTIEQDWLDIHVFGQLSSRHPVTDGKRVLVVSPFLSDEGFDPFDGCESISVISRPEQMNALSDETKQWLIDPEPSLFCIDDRAALDEDEEENFEVQWDLSGLHAKIYAFERGARTHLMIGSANATYQGWNRNDEILVEMVMSKRTFIDSMVEAKSDFGSLLREHRLNPPDEPDQKQELREQLEQMLRTIASVPFSATIAGADETGWQEIVVSQQPLDFEMAGARMTLSLMTDSISVRNLVAGCSVNEIWILSEMEAATPFLRLSLDKDGVSVSTVVLAELRNSPEDRLDRIFAQYISRPDLFLQLVSLLLTESGDTDSFVSNDFSITGEGSSASSLLNGVGLLETLLSALSRSPKALDDVNRLVRQLRASAKGREVFPSGWEALWESVQSARKKLEDSHD
jgi:hypothetical protein